MEIMEINKLLDLSGKTAIVTGAVGIGFGIAYRLVEAGANVVIAARSQDQANESAKKLIEKGWRVKAVRADVSIESDVKEMVEKTVADFGSIDISVNNAGIYPSIPVMRMTLSDVESDDIGKVALFLASDMSSYMTESQIIVDGGVLLS